MDNNNLLIEKYLSESLGQAEKEKLLDLLNSSEEFKREFQEACNIKGLIYTAANDQAIVIDVMDKVTEADRDLENKIMKQIPKPSKSPVMAIIKLAAAAVLAFIFIKFGSNAVNTVASIDKSPDTVIKRASGQNSNSKSIMVNDTIQTGASNEKISFNDGTKLDLKGKSELKVLSKHPKVFELNKGSISAEVSPQDKAMIIETPSAKIEVLGTAFKLTSQKKNSLLKVSKGKVAITDKKTKERVVVTKGEYTIAEGKKLNVRQGKGPLYVSDTITSEFEKRYIDIEVNLTGEKQLVLVASYGNDSKLGDHTAWLNPLLNINGRWTSLTKMKPKLIKVGKGSFQNYQSTENPQQLLLHGKSYVRGIYAHATSVLVWDLPPNTRMLKCRGAILDSGLQESNSFSARFEVYTDISQQLLDQFLKKD